MNAVPDRQRLAVVGETINDLVSSVERDPQAALEQLAVLMSEVQDWARSDAYLYCLLLTARALRFLDHLDEAVLSAEAGLRHAHGELAAQLHLEAGMSLNQHDRPHAAEPHLRAAAQSFRDADDPAGVAWSLTSLAESLCATGRSRDAASAIEEALICAYSDDRARLRALKQKAVIARQLGRLPEASAYIEEVLAADPPSQMRANALLELGHIRSHGQDYRGADTALVEAAVEYAANRDDLGTANTYRALATNDLLLGRIESGVRRLDQAADLYQRIGNRSGRANTLCERGTVRLAQDSTDLAAQDAATAHELFTANDDKFGLSRTFRLLARVAASRGDVTEVAAALSRALRAAEESSSPLAVAGSHLLTAELASRPPERLHAAVGAAAVYRQLALPLGVAHANALAAAAALRLNQPGRAEEFAGNARTELYAARTAVVDPDIRADHNFSSRDVVSTILHVCTEIATPSSTLLAADTILDDFPLGLRDALASGTLSPATQSVLRRIASVRSRNSGTIDLATERPLLRQLAITLATLPSIDIPTHRLSMTGWHAGHPDSCVIAIGAPTPGAQLPIAWALPDHTPAVSMPTVSEHHVNMIDALGSVASTESDREMLWHPEKLTWQTTLASLLIPQEITEWLMQTPTPPEIIVTVAPVLSHVPLEALLIDALPLGVRAALRRLPTAIVRRGIAQIESTTAYFDPDLDWVAERATLHADDIVDDAAQLRGRLGERRLTIIGCHGNAETGLAGTLTSSDTTVVATAADFLAQRLDSAVLLLEACWTSRYLGARTGEHVTLATAALLAGAHSVIAGSFALPADDLCTGRIAATLLRGVQDGVPAAEALRRARAEYWARPPTQLRLPGSDPASLRVMSGTAPWAWAGLSSHG